MSKSDKGTIVLVLIALGLSGALYLKWRDRRFVEVAQSIDACDEEAAVQRKTGTLGSPARDDRKADSRIVSWERNGKVLTVSFVAPPTGKLVVGSVLVAVTRYDDPPEILYQDTTGLQRCR